MVARVLFPVLTYRGTRSYPHTGRPSRPSPPISAALAPTDHSTSSRFSQLRSMPIGCTSRSNARDTPTGSATRTLNRAE